MKHYYFRNILNQIYQKKMESFIVFSIVLIMSVFLSLLHFFGYSDSMESNIANTLSLRYEIKNNHFFGPDTSVGFGNFELKDYYDEFIEFIEKVEENDAVEYADYNLNMTLLGGYIKETGQSNTHQIFGISNENYFEDNYIEIIEGRMLTQEEIESNKLYAVISSKTQKLVGEEYVPIQLGETIILGESDIENGGVINSLELEVIGIYEYKEQSVYFEQNDAFVNSRGIIISNGLVKEYMDEHPDDYYKFKINHICFYLNYYKKYIEFQDVLNDEIKAFNSEMTKLGYSEPNLIINETNTNSIIQSVLRIKNIYRIVFLIVFTIIALILISSVYYLLKKKTGEMSVYYSLGQSRRNIILHYLLTYMIIGILAILIGIGIGYFLSNQISVMMLKENAELQSELLRFTSAIFDSTNINNNINDLSFDFASAVLVMIETLGVITISVLASMLMIMNDKILSRNGGWNS